MVSDGFLETKIEFLKGVGPQRADLLRKELGIATFGDLLFHFPFRYVDRTRYYTIREVTGDMPYVQIRGRIIRLAVKGDKRRKHLSGVFQDETGTLELKWFQGLKWIMQSLKLNTDYVLFGRPSVFNGVLNVVHPELETKETASAEATTALQPVYPTTEKLKAKGLDTKGLLKLQRQLHLQLSDSFPENLPQAVVKQYRFINRRQALGHLHFPDSTASLQQAESRIKFEEFFYIQLRLLNQKALRTRNIKGMMFNKVGEYFNSFYKDHLPFPLTEAQKRVIREIRSDCGSGRQMNRLLQGDVGSGKTVVALLSMLIALDNGYQACMMAPTEILATQHAESINQLLEGTGLSCHLLTGSTRTADRKRILEGIADGSIRLLIGTHALIEDRVRFKELGFVVIDEQHRFGVEQRARLWEKNELAPHILVMTATPIPRTLAMTLYGDLDVSIIDELPPGRKPISTVHRSESNRLQVWQFLKTEVLKGRQVYIVYPLIEESEKSDLNNLMQGYDAVCKDFPAPTFRVSIVHGKMKPADKDFEMERFKRGQTQIMVATTVIEVGVNVPNASVMVIENAERFGLSQLHQLRGRVGRGAEQSYCILMTSAKLGNDARQRIRTMCETNDGFRIAETDLQLRGPGDAEGTRQSGVLDLRLADLGRDAALIPPAREAAARLLELDPSLMRPEHAEIRHQLDQLLRASGSWGRIS